MLRSWGAILVLVAAFVGAAPVPGETPEEAEARKLRERKELENDMLDMHHWSAAAPVPRSVRLLATLLAQPPRADNFLHTIAWHTRSHGAQALRTRCV